MRRLLETPPVRQPVSGTGLDLDGLAAFLCTRGYDSEPRCQIMRRVIDDGCLDGAVPLWLDLADLADATEALVDSQPVHPQESDAWGSRSDEPSMFRLADDVWSLGPDPIPPDAVIVPPELDPEDDDPDPPLDPEPDPDSDSGRLDRRLRELSEGWEPFHPEAPTPDEADAIQAMRTWYDDHEDFGAWLENQGGDR